MTSCAYCGQERTLTKEHIWPQSLIRKYETLRTFNPRTNKFHSGEPVIKDVCQECNNGQLSILDTCLNELFDKFFGHVVDAGESARFKFNFDKLLRAVLKISYNSSRIALDKNSVLAHKKFANYILHGGYKSKLMLRLQIVTSSRVVNLIDKSEEILRPVAMRCATLAYDGRMSNRFLVRIIAFNSY
jgi:hypothetical protein